MGVPDLLHLLIRTSSRSKQCYPFIRPLSASLHMPIKVVFDQRSNRYSGGPSGEKGTSTAEEFQRVAAEKIRKQHEDSGGNCKPQIFEESDQQTVKKKYEEEEEEEEEEKPKKKADYPIRNSVSE